MYTVRDLLGLAMAVFDFMNLKCHLAWVYYRAF